jgi:Kip1 ubiquitination-promoting complex protein 1
MTHVSNNEIEKVKKLIEVLQMRQSLLSETTLISEDALCPICYAQQNGKRIRCRHSGAENFILLNFQMSFSSRVFTNRVILALPST